MNFRTQQAANRRKTIGLLVGMGVLVWLVALAALTYFGQSTTAIVPLAVDRFRVEVLKIVLKLVLDGSITKLPVPVNV